MKTALSVSGSVSEWVSDSFRFGDSYRISELRELVLLMASLNDDDDEASGLDDEADETYLFVKT